MACDHLACINAADGCIEVFPNGNPGNAMVIGGDGKPAWNGPVGIGISDAGGYFSADNVESALQQLAVTLQQLAATVAAGQPVSCSSVLSCITPAAIGATVLSSLALSTQAADCAMPPLVMGANGFAYNPSIFIKTSTQVFIDYQAEVQAMQSNVGVTIPTTYWSDATVVTNPSLCRSMNGYVVVNPSGALFMGGIGNHAAVMCYVNIGAGFVLAAEHRVRINGSGDRMEQFVNRTPLGFTIPAGGLKNIQFQMRYEVLGGIAAHITFPQFAAMVWATT